MADNYLEKRMEDYRNGNLRPSKHVTPRPVRSSAPEARLKLSCRSVALAIGEWELCEAVVRRFTPAGCKVAFAHPDRKAGAALSQQTASIYMPADVIDREAAQKLAEILSDRGLAPDLIITDMPDAAPESGITVYHLHGLSRELPPDAIAYALLLASTAGFSPDAIAKITAAKSADSGI